MSLFDKMRRQKLLSFSLILFTLSIGIVDRHAGVDRRQGRKRPDGRSRRDATDDPEPRATLECRSALWPSSSSRRW